MEEFNKLLNKDLLERKKTEKLIKASLKEKEVLLRELHHRVKNNMQIISSLLKLQSKYIKDKKYADIFNECQDRIAAMSLVHENLYQSGDLSNVDFSNYVKTLAKNLIRSRQNAINRIDLKTDVKDVFLLIDTAIPCGLIINELVTNALKHAFPDHFFQNGPEHRKGEISVSLRSMNEREFELIVRDNGIGMPEDFDFKKTESFGLKIVYIIAENQLDGKIKMNYSAASGRGIKERTFFIISQQAAGN